MLQEGYSIFGETDGTTVIFYIDKNKPKQSILIPTINSFYLENETLAYVVGYIQKSVVSIGSFYSKKKGTRQGIVVLAALCRFVKETFPQVKNVDLDDSTGVNPPKNIYYRMGFKVRDEKTNFYIKWDNWLSKYSHLENPSEERRISLETLIKNLNEFK